MLGLNKKLVLLGALSMLGAISCPAPAIQIDGSGDYSGIQALYIFSNFNPTTGVVPDSSGVGANIDLTVDHNDATHVNLDTQYDPISQRNVTGLKINVPVAIRSLVSPTKVIQACGTNNEFTIDMWVRNLAEEPLGVPQPTRIFGLRRKGTTTHSGNLFIGQRYDSAGRYAANVQSGNNQMTYTTADEKGVLMFGSNMPAQRIVFTKDANGIARLWVSNSTGLLQLRSEETGAPSITGWTSDANAANLRFSFGNEPFYSDFPELVAGQTGPEWKYWRGTLYAAAIYCVAKSPTDLLGARAPGSAALPSIAVAPNDPISAELKRAQLIYRRITGINTPIDTPLLKQMETLIRAGDAIGAARLATNESQFYNVTVRDMAARMSVRDETVNTPLNDMVATIIGIALRDIDAREMLTGNFTFRGDVNLAAVPNDEVNDFLKSNNHYQALEDGRFDLSRVLVRVDGQKLFNGATGAVVLNPDAAGVLTSRAFMAAHSIDGTNRRDVEHTFRQFLCIPINQWADVEATDTYVGRDVDRAPGADTNKYKTTCRACHSVMDSFRGAFAKVDFSANYVKQGDVMFGLSNGVDNKDDEGLMFQDPPGISGKMNRNATTFAGGNPVTSTYWENNANRGLNKEYFGWPAIPAGQTKHSGYGIKSFATLVSQAQAFPRCLAMRTFRSVCKRDPTSTEKEALNLMASQFAADGYKLRDIFARVAASPLCLGN